MGIDVLAIILAIMAGIGIGFYEPICSVEDRRFVPGLHDIKELETLPEGKELTI